MANREQLYEYKGNCCVYCRLSVTEMVERFGTFNRVFALDHVDPKEKHPDYDNLIRRTISSEQLDEIDKCLLLCEICHGIRHSQDISGKLQLTVQAEGKQASQILNGYFIVDQKLTSVTFLTNERLIAIPYWVIEGDKQPVIYFGTELETDLLAELLRKLPDSKVVVVADYRSSRKLLTARHLEGDRIDIELDISFPIPVVELSGETPDSPFVWIRNGIALKKSGEVIHEGTFRGRATLKSL